MIGPVGQGGIPGGRLNSEGVVNAEQWSGKP
jgi:hypothetical protein